uniref:BZIP domain-containing protein n=1 Tax=Peronospora matthiolae TaxID=2874970 RepID=A0AAV1TLI8_9STRA
MASQELKHEQHAAPDLGVVEVERKRKQRELKRKSRERKKRNILELQTTAQALELEYKELIAAKLKREEQGKQQQSEGMTVKSDTNVAEIEQSQIAELQKKYSAVRDEMHELREQMTGFKQKLEEYERFIAMLDGHLMDFQDVDKRQEESSG